MEDTFLFLVVGQDMLHLSHDGALHGFNLTTQFS